MLHEQSELTGTVHQGVIVIDQGIALPEGQTVKIIVQQPAPETAVTTSAAPAGHTNGADPQPLSPLAQMLLKYAGVIDDLPADMAKNHDHYLYGAPKREE